MTSTSSLPETSFPAGSIEPTQIAKDHGTEALKDIAYGSIAGSLGKVLEYPFDTVKVRLQAQPLHLPPLYTGAFDCFRQGFLTGGIRGLYRGISAPLTGAAVETSSLFFSYRIAQDVLLTVTNNLRDDGYIESKLSLGGLAACGAASGAFTSLLLTPIELVKCQMQVPPLASTIVESSRPGIVAVISSIFRHQGLFGFWHGQLGTLIRETGGSASWFGSYEGVSEAFRRWNIRRLEPYSPPSMDRQPLQIWQQLLAGAAAGVSYNFFFSLPTQSSRECRPRTLTQSI
ncbi:hypothetical protein G7Y79_00036g072330 [Physcia stellaris]|nr:hypothetical protein G7Y79_00036g072330 [Physcia stellaris]